MGSQPTDEIEESQANTIPADQLPTLLDGDHQLESQNLMDAQPREWDVGSPLEEPGKHDLIAAAQAPTAEQVAQDKQKAQGSDTADATMKLLKRMGYPEVETPARSSSVLPKIISAAMKRLKKIEDLLAVLQPVASESQMMAKNLVCKTC